MNPCVSAYSEHFPQPNLVYFTHSTSSILHAHTDLLHVSEHALVALTLAGPLVEVAAAVVPGPWAGIMPTVTFTLLLCTSPGSLQAVLNKLSPHLNWHVCKESTKYAKHSQTDSGRLSIILKITHGLVKISNNIVHIM